MNTLGAAKFKATCLAVMDDVESKRECLGAVEQNITVLPITPAIALRATRFVLPYPRNPADRLIGATAVELGLKLVTKDKLLRAPGQVATIW